MISSSRPSSRFTTVPVAEPVVPSSRFTKTRVYLEDESTASCGAEPSSERTTKSGRFLVSAPTSDTEDVKENGDQDNDSADNFPPAEPPGGVIFEITSEDSGNEDDISDSIKQDVEINA